MSIQRDIQIIQDENQKMARIFEDHQTLDKIGGLIEPYIDFLLSKCPEDSTLGSRFFCVDNGFDINFGFKESISLNTIARFHVCDRKIFILGEYYLVQCFKIIPICNNMDVALFLYNNYYIIHNSKKNYAKPLNINKINKIVNKLFC